MLQGYLWGSIITFIALIGSLMVSYVRARAEVWGWSVKSVSCSVPNALC